MDILMSFFYLAIDQDFASIGATSEEGPYSISKALI